MENRLILQVKVLSYKSPQRYAVKRTLGAALTELRKTHPGAELEITEIKELDEMLRYTQVVILPSLLIHEKLVCIGRFPHKGETLAWLQAEAERLILQAGKA